MSKKKTGINQQGGEGRLPALGGAFFLGALAGSLCCARIEGLQEALQSRGQASLTLWQALWPNLVLLCVILLSGYLRAGCLTALITMAVKGFFLSAEATCQVLILGSRGYAAAITQEFLPGFFTLAALILLGRQAMGWSAARLGLPPGRGKRIRPDSTYLLTAAICTLLMLLAAAVELRVVPGLWSALQSFLPT